MKKLIAVFISFMCSFNSFTQFSENFESYSLAPDTFDNGAGLGGDFIFNPVVLNNVYDTAWGGSWTGFAISNRMDDTTAGYGNQYSAYPGMGNDSSSNYAVGYYSPMITGLDSTIYIDSFKITNTTYAALSMRDGDAFAKKFGSIYDASGAVDSTNGEDYFRVWIIGENYAGTKDSIEFYLADYRFQDSTQDYIVDEWVNIDLTELGIYWPTKITFKFESSDEGQWGINTPVYFAIDDVAWSSTTGLSELTEVNYEVYPNPFQDVLLIRSEADAHFKLINLNGEIIQQGLHQNFTHLSVTDLPNGVYLLILESESGISTHKLIK